MDTQMKLCCYAARLLTRLVLPLFVSRRLNLSSRDCYCHPVLSASHLNVVSYDYHTHCQSVNTGTKNLHRETLFSLADYSPHERVTPLYCQEHQMFCFEGLSLAYPCCNLCRYYRSEKLQEIQLVHGSNVPILWSWSRPTRICTCVGWS